MAPEFFAGKLNICITSLDRHEEGSAKVISFKIGQRMLLRILK
jgi:hypothetical protein